METILIHILYFFFWTLVIYVMHILAHKIPFLMYFHADHHIQIYRNNYGKWKWSNLFIWIDTWKTTGDQWLTEVIPTFIFAWITGAWWIFIAYWIWSATFQELIEHNTSIDFYPLEVSGKWHMVHHTYPNKNYGIIHPFWDIIFGTDKRHY